MPNLFVTYNYSFNDLLATEKLPLPYFYLDSGLLLMKFFSRKLVWWSIPIVLNFMHKRYFSFEFEIKTGLHLKDEIDISF